MLHKQCFLFTGEYSDDYLAAHAFTFFLDGYETSSMALIFTLYEIASNDDVQYKLKQEIDAVLLEYDGVISYEALKKMDYLENTFLGNYLYIY